MQKGIEMEGQLDVNWLITYYLLIRGIGYNIESPMIS